MNRNYHENTISPHQENLFDLERMPGFRIRKECVYMPRGYTYDQIAARVDDMRYHVMQYVASKIGNSDFINLEVQKTPWGDNSGTRRVLVDCLVLKPEELRSLLAYSYEVGVVAGKYVRSARGFEYDFKESW